MSTDIDVTAPSLDRFSHGDGDAWRQLQQLVFRPTPGSGRPETPITGLDLASAPAHPGSGVHGVCGSNAAAALLHERLGSLGRLRRN